MSAHSPRALATSRSKNPPEKRRYYLTAAGSATESAAILDASALE